MNPKGAASIRSKKVIIIRMLFMGVGVVTEGVVAGSVE